MFFLDKGFFDEFFSLVGQIEISKVRIWIMDFFDVLVYFYSNGIVYQDIYFGNILFCRMLVGDIVFKFFDGGFQKEFYSIFMSMVKVVISRVVKFVYWYFVEIVGIFKFQYMQKIDIWDFGIVFLQMVFGFNVFEKYYFLLVLMDFLLFLSFLEELVFRFFKVDFKKWFCVFEFCFSEFFVINVFILVENDFVVVFGLFLLVFKLLLWRFWYDLMNWIVVIF